MNRRQDARQRSDLEREKAGYPEICLPAAEIDQPCLELATAARKQPTSARDRSDLRHIAYAVRAGAQVVLTWDEPSRRKWGTAALELHDVAVVTPAELGAVLDERDYASGYRPVALLGTGYTRREVGVADTVAVQAFLDMAGGEHARDFIGLHRQLAYGRSAGAHRLLFFDPAQMPVALLGYKVDHHAVDVSLMRMRSSAIAPTLAAQLTARLRAIATEA